MSIAGDLEEPLLLPVSSDEEVPPSGEQTANSPESSVHRKCWKVASSELLLVSFLFSTLNVSLRGLYTIRFHHHDPPTPPQVNAIRGWFTIFFFLPLLMARKLNHPEESSVSTTSTESVRPIWSAAGELALFNFGGQVFVNVGLLSTSSARAAFIGQTVVVLVPLICALGGGSLRKQDLLGCLSSSIGVFLFSTTSDAPGSSRSSLNPGDWWILASAICFSCYLVRISHFAKRYDEVTLQGIKNTLMAFLYSLWCAGSILFNDNIEWHWSQSWVPWTIIVYTAAAPGCLADILQQKAQQVVGATQSNLILCTSSVFTAILGRVLLGEATTWLENLGGAFLIAGAVVAGSK